jgi:hypothetical protein
MKLILIFFAGYLLVYLGLNLLARRYRRRLVECVGKAKKASIGKHNAAVLDVFVHSMTSMRTAIVLFLIFIELLVLPNEQLLRDDLSREDRNLWETGLMPEILDNHMASAAAANPFFGALAYLARFFVHLRFRWLGEKTGVSELRTFTIKYAG